MIKLGGRSLDAPDATAELAESLAELEAPIVLVHGGGREVSHWCSRLGHARRFDAGLRVTDTPTLEVAAAVLAGLANARLVASLIAAGVDAVGLSALDGGLVEAVPHPDAARLGHVGIAAFVRPRLLERLLADGYTPVISSIGAHQGALLNINADEVAGALAAALRAHALIMLSDVEGLVLDERPVPRIDAADVRGLLNHPDVRDGMLPKLEAADRAVNGGAACAVIAAWHGPHTLFRLLAGELPATTVMPSSKETPHV